MVASKSSKGTNESSLSVTDINNALPSLFRKDQPHLNEYASYNISLSARIPDKLKQNIWNNKFMEMEQLLPGASRETVSINLIDANQAITVRLQSNTSKKR